MPHTAAAFVELEKLIQTFSALEAKSMLYVGWRPDARPWWQEKFGQSIGVKEFGVLEIFKENVEYFKTLRKDYKCEVYHGDVREIEKHTSKDKYDVIFWDHGPEHVSWEDLKNVTPKLKEYASKLLLYCCPLGRWPQGAEGGNEHEEHKNDVTVEQFEELGLTCITTGSPGQASLGEIIGYSVKK